MTMDPAQRLTRLVTGGSDTGQLHQRSKRISHGLPG
jgi:hypothetical protein